MDGFTYERQAIERWLRTHDTSPKTNATLDSKLLMPNIALKQASPSHHPRLRSGQAAGLCSALALLRRNPTD